MTINVGMVGTTIHVLVDEQIPDGVLTVTSKLDMWDEADVKWGLMKPPPPTPLGDPNGRSLGEVRVAALKYVKGLIDQEIRRLGGQP
jgi:hypothetical protein